MFAFIGGGSSYPGVTGFGSGRISLIELLAASTEGTIDIYGGHMTISRSGDIHPVLIIQLSDGSSGLELQMRDNLGNMLWELDADGSQLLAAGLGTHGVPAQTTPRTLAQATIMAITDANAKASIQAVANALSDIGALTIT